MPWLAGQGLAAEPGALWRIGQADNNTAEFAHAPGNYRACHTPGPCLVGQSEAKRDRLTCSPARSAEAGRQAGRGPLEGKNEKARATIDMVPFEIVTLRSEF